MVIALFFKGYVLLHGIHLCDQRDNITCCYYSTTTFAERLPWVLFSCPRWTACECRENRHRSFLDRLHSWSDTTWSNSIPHNSMYRGKTYFMQETERIYNKVVYVSHMHRGQHSKVIIGERSCKKQKGLLTHLGLCIPQLQLQLLGLQCVHLL